jgi:hypothetical protein
MTEEYRRRQAKFGCKVGDRLKVLAKCESHAGGWEAGWNQRMDITVGYYGTVGRIDEGGIYLEFDEAHRNGMEYDRPGWWYPYFVLSFPTKRAKSPPEDVSNAPRVGMLQNSYEVY